jgi:hypothetical protein
VGCLGDSLVLPLEEAVRIKMRKEYVFLLPEDSNAGTVNT